MANTETIIWTAVPNGISPPGATASTLRLSVHVAPQLQGGPTLTPFSDFHNWPSLITALPPNAQPLTFKVSFFNGAVAAGSTTVAIPTSQLRADLWTALFSPASSISVMPRDPGEPYTDLPVISYPAGHIAAWLQANYTNWAVNNATDFPTVQELLSVLEPLGYVGPEGEKELQRVLGELADERNTPTTPPKTKRANDFTGVTDEEAFAALRYYHSPRPLALASIPQPVIDFNRALTFIGEHRALQRALGLVFDIGVAPPTSITSNMFVSVAPTNFTGATGYTSVSPRTRCNVSGTVFEARPSTSQINARQLTLGDTSSFLVHEVDVDGGGLKTAQFADNLQMSRNPQASPLVDTGGVAAPDAPGSYAPPSLRSAGLSVTAVNRGLTFVSKLDRSESLLDSLPGPVPDLNAEDLVRGFVLDIHDASRGGWNSTAMRDVTYHAPSLTAGDVTSSDEASTDAPPRMASDATDPKQLNLPQNLIRWDGWSMAAPRPGVPIQDDGSVAPGGVDPGPFGQLTITPTVPPGTLPRLRFGETYAVRMRVVDIAGNVIDISDGAGIGSPGSIVSPPILYGRHEPIPSPDVYHHADSFPGESLGRVVIRGNWDVESTNISPRTFAPRPISQLFAEHHGLFDLNPTTRPQLDPDAYALIISHESNRYADTGPIPTTDAVPFLPDPLSRGGMLTVQDGTLAGNRVAFDFSPATGQVWPNYRPYRLQLEAGPAQATSIDATDRVITFTLTKADVVTARLSSTFAAGDLPVLGLYNWVSEHFGGSVPVAYQSDTVAGQHWAITPYSTIELVYAVRQPLLVPLFLIAADREIGWTYVNLRGEFVFSRKSTSKIDMLATWNEPVDDGPGPTGPSGPGVPAPDNTGRDVSAHAFTQPIEPSGADLVEPFGPVRHEFFDTKHRVVTYSGNATSSFTEHFAEHLDLAVPAPGVATALSSIGLEPGSVKVTDAGVALAENTAFTIDPVGGTITFLATGPAPGTPVGIDFLPPVSRATPAANVQTLDILSSARPATPQIRDVVPIYEWSPVLKSGAKTASGRSPSALRIYLERPWWSSGVGELLGVLVLPAAKVAGAVAALPGASAISPSVAPYVSDWGSDPLFSSPALPTLHPTLATFPNSPAADHGANLTIEESASVRVDVAGHPVSYDPTRQLWYCDVRVNIGKSYTPMIRLALARYQPNSLPGVELSRVVLADVMSLEPGRAVVITRSGNTLKTVTLAGYSYHEAADKAGTGPGLAQVTVERRVPAIKDPVLGWEAVGKPHLMAPFTASSGLTTWTARAIHLPAHGKLRLSVEQYELLPTDNRSHQIYATFVPRNPTGFRLLYQDLIDL